MVRLLGFFVLVALTALVALMLASLRGYVEIRAGDYLVRENFNIFVTAILILTLIWGGVFHAVLRTVTIPKAMMKAAKENRAKRGHKALSDGLIAVAADDPAEAHKQAGLAAKFLETPGASLLLTAQSAQLNGDIQAAGRYFEAMLNDPATRFLGLRGLIVQSLQADDIERTLDLLAEAKAIKPHVPWVLDLEYDLRLERGELVEAQNAAASLSRLPGADKENRGQGLKLAVTLLAQAVQAAKEDDKQAALDKAERAAKAAPQFFAAQSIVAQLAMEVGHKRQAFKALLRAWRVHPSGDVATRMLEAKSVSAGNFQAKLSVAEHLLKEQPKHWVGTAVYAEALIDAGKGKKAQKLLDGLGEDKTQPEMMALQTRIDIGDGRAPSEQVNRSRKFDLRPGFFVCSTCATRQEQWSSHCSQCGCVSSIDYQSAVSKSSEQPQTAKKHRLGSVMRKLQ